MSKFWILMFTLAIAGFLALANSAGAQSQICPDGGVCANTATVTVAPTCTPGNTGCHTASRITVVVPTTGIALPATTVYVAATPNTTQICIGPEPCSTVVTTSTPVHELH